MFALGTTTTTHPTPTTVDLLDQQAGGHSDAVAHDVAKAVYALAAASGSESAYNTLVNMYEQVGRHEGWVRGEGGRCWGVLHNTQHTCVCVYQCA